MSVAVPKVSVVIAAYNAEAMVGDALASVASQTLRDFETIVVDDASSDRTRERAARILAGSGLAHRIVRLEVNGGPSSARNAGVRLARGQYVAFLDADDAWLPEKLERQVALMDANPEVRLCGCQATWVDEDGGVLGPLFRDVPAVSAEGWKRLLWDCYVATPCAMVRRSDLGVAPFDERLRIAEDRDLWIRLAGNGSVALVQDSLVLIRRSSGSFMSRHMELISQHTGPMIRRHLRAHSEALSAFDKMRANGKIYSEIGKGLCAQSSRLSGCGYLIAAAALGYSPWDNLRFALYNMPCLRLVKDWAKRLRKNLSGQGESLADKGLPRADRAPRPRQAGRS